MAFRGKYEQSHVVVKVIQWLGCIFLFSIPAMGSIVLFPQPLSVGALKWVQLIQTAAIFLLPPLCMAYLWSKLPLEWLKMKGKKLKVKGDILWAVVLMLVALPAINMLGYLNQQMTLPIFLEPLEQWMKTAEENAALLTEQFLSVTTISGLIINISWHLLTVTKAMYDAYTDPAGDYQWTKDVFYQAYAENEIQTYAGMGYTEEQILAAMFLKGEQNLYAEGPIPHHTGRRNTIPS